jgi:hypothetical protein
MSMQPIPETYSFTTTWKIKAPVTQVWNAIYYSEDWPSWWKDFASVQEMEKGDAQSIGSVRVYNLKSPFRYTLMFRLLLTEKKEPYYLKGTASGDLQGSGEWYFEENNGITTVTCLWQVATTIWWMNRLSFLLKPFFRYNHSMVMANGAKALARKINATLIEVKLT